MDKKAPVNVHNLKTKPPDDEWSTPYDRALQNTAFVKKNDKSSAACRAFQKSPDGNDAICIYSI